ncbi:dihydropteroate synthase [Flavobacterium litorale]|uniref:Dihydropteroate synthase n=1 Tax=Flavobacterium litorale TaxID=2856519 RepID=A0ABX8V6F4_9FLAO|nr:dihydropteroate synthase [Flavobacterium litorale]QYJ68072.1 dihydropteroate synthase [Flavobacterium litorale]
MLINCKGNLIDLAQPRVMGVVNCTPDSFYDGGKYKNENDFLKQTERMLNEDADFIDIGAYSSRPNADFVSVTEELQRIVPVVELVLKHFPEALISIDTFRAEVAKTCIDTGAAIVNDISAGMLDEKMLETVGKLQVPYIMMHMRGTSQTMQTLTQYDDIIKEMLFYFSERSAAAQKCGINDIIIDPGFGFAKTLAQNYQVMQKLELFKMTELPILAGVSRKSMIYKLLETKPEEALNGTTVLNTIALTKGANILRVHDVKEAVEAIKIMMNFEF